MRVGLLSDTHIPEAAAILPPEIMEALQGVDLILHAGDIYMLPVLNDLERVAPVLAARGDDDYIDTATDKRVKDKHVLQLEGHKLWLVHERPYYLGTEWRQAKLAPGQNEYEAPDIVVFGHIHRTVVEQVDGILYVCPGSPTFLNYLCGLGTVGILDINSSGADVRILQL
jgi:putative phosphoesterase